jgi:hypothetical protein
VRLIEVTGGKPIGSQDRLPVECSPLLIGRRLRHVGDDHVRVQVRVLRPARAVLICGGNESNRMLAAPPLRPTPDHARLVLEMGERRLPSTRVRLTNGATDLLATKRVQQADALRR